MYYFAFLILIFFPFCCIKGGEKPTEAEIETAKEAAAVATQQLEELENEKTKEKADLEIAVQKRSYFIVDPLVEADIKKHEARLRELEQQLIPEAQKTVEQKDNQLSHLIEEKKVAELQEWMASLQAQEQLLQIPPKPTSFLDPLPIADWLNLSQIQSFFNPLFRTVSNREENFNSIHSLGQYYLEIQPYGFSSDFDLHDDSFKLKTLGLALQGGINLAERWMVGGGVGYGHSHLDYNLSFKDTNINTLYVGPFASCLFEKGYIQLRLLGVYNSYSISKESSQGWDLDAQLEGGLDFEVEKFFGPRFFIQPNLKLDYLMVFQDENGAVDSVKTTQANFFSSRLAVQFSKEFPKENQGILIPAVSLGWVLMQPLSQKTSCHEGYTNVSYKSCNQAYVRVTLTGIHKRGIVLSAGFDGYFGKLYPVYACNLKVGFEW